MVRGERTYRNVAKQTSYGYDEENAPHLFLFFSFARKVVSRSEHAWGEIGGSSACHTKLKPLEAVSGVRSVDDISLDTFEDSGVQVNGQAEDKQQPRGSDSGLIGFLTELKKCEAIYVHTMYICMRFLV